MDISLAVSLVILYAALGICLGLMISGFMAAAAKARAEEKKLYDDLRVRLAGKHPHFIFPRDLID